MKQFLVTIVIMCCVNEMICNALLAIWNGFCIIMNHVHNYFCCHIIIYTLYGNDTSIYRNMKKFSNNDNAFSK